MLLLRLVVVVWCGLVPVPSTASTTKAAAPIPVPCTTETIIITINSTVAVTKTTRTVAMALATDVLEKATNGVRAGVGAAVLLLFLDGAIVLLTVLQ